MKLYALLWASKSLFESFINFEKFVKLNCTINPKKSWMCAFICSCQNSDFDKRGIIFHTC